MASDEGKITFVFCDDSKLIFAVLAVVIIRLCLPMLNTHKGIFYCWTKLSSKTHFKSSDTDIQRDVELQLPGLAYSESCPSEVFPPLTSSSKPEASASAQRDHHGNKRPERKAPDNRNTIILVSSRL